MLARSRHLGRLRGLLQWSPAVAILGARQVGKTTVARAIADDWPEPALFDLENPVDLERLRDPMLALQRLQGLVILDEIQRKPDLFPLLRVLIDRPGHPTRFLLLGSASPELLQQSSESLAGRIVYHELGGFALDEVSPAVRDQLWLRGGFPRSFLAETNAISSDWRGAFIKTFLERDLPQLGIRIPATTMRRFWTMIAHYHAQVWNGAELARAFGVSATTVRRYLDLLTSALVLRQLQPWYEDTGKRQVRSPKVYITDSGLLHTLLGITTDVDLDRHPKVGASWEGFALGEIVTRLGATPDECFFWKAHSGPELDLLVVRGERRLGFEFKRSSAPRLTRSMHSAMSTLHLQRLDVVHAGEHTFALAENCRAVALRRILDDVTPLD